MYYSVQSSYIIQLFVGTLFITVKIINKVEEKKTFGFFFIKHNKYFAKRLLSQ